MRRAWGRRVYYLFPGGGVEPGETPEQAAVREAREELGVEVRLGRLLHDEVYEGERFVFFAAAIVGGRFGTGRGAEMLASGTTPEGTFDAVWVPVDELARLDVRPRELAQQLLVEEAVRAQQAARVQPDGA